MQCHEYISAAAIWNHAVLHSVAQFSHPFATSPARGCGCVRIRFCRMFGIKQALLSFLNLDITLKGSCIGIVNILSENVAIPTRPDIANGFTTELTGCQWPKRNVSLCFFVWIYLVIEVSAWHCTILNLLHQRLVPLSAVALFED